MRRSFFLFLVTALTIFGVYRYWKLSHDRPRLRTTLGSYTPADAPKVDLKDMQVLASLDAEYTRLVEAVVPSVVSIDTSGTVLVQRPQMMDPFDLFFPNRRPRGAVEQQRSSLGSGVIVSREGHILTNHHVVAGMDQIVVKLTDGRREPAQLIGSDEQTDIAVLKINAGNLDPLPFGDSDAVRVGQMVFAVGNPFGLQETVTQGIISAKGRRAMRDSGVEFLQTDVAVNQGNSGGPLINLRGEIVGINSAIYSNSNEGSWLGISFAIPANTARRTLESLLKTGRVVRGYLGVMMSSVSRENARALGLRDTSGVLIAEIVPGSPAEAMGLKPGDVVRTFNGRPVADPVALVGRLADTDIGAEVELGIVRGGQQMTLRTKVAEAPAAPALQQRTPQRQPAPRVQAPPAGGPAHPLAAIRVGEIPATVRERLPQNVDGILITQIPADSPLAQKLRAGDIILELNKRPMRGIAAFERETAALGALDKVMLSIARGTSRLFVTVP